MVSVVIGSWGSYNECNERALGSKWLDLSDYEDWEEIEEMWNGENYPKMYCPKCGKPQFVPIDIWKKKYKYKK